MIGTGARTTLVVCASLVVALVIASPVLASDAVQPVEQTMSSQDGPCVVVSTDPPGAGVYLKCSGSGTAYVDGEQVLPP